MKKLDTLVQYLFKDEEHEVENLLPHGNSKKNLYRCTRLALEASVDSKEKTSKEILDNVYHSVGDVTEARSLGQLPRGPSNIFNARFGEKSSSRSHESEHQSKNVNELNVIWQLLEKAKREEKECDNSTSIREWRIHPDFLVVLASDCQLQDLEHFCTNSEGFSILGVDPTLHIFQENISLTVMTYRNLKLHHGVTKKSPVFIGPVLMHQWKDCKTYSRFANSLVTECPDLDGLIACGTDGEKALIDRLKRNLRFALFLRCFIHFRDNVKRELEKKRTADAKKAIVREIFGKQEEQVKYAWLVDSNNEEEFQMNLEEQWNTREAECGASTHNSTFYAWFCKGKV